MWPELQKARDNAERIEREIRNLLKDQNALKRREISKQMDTIINSFEESVNKIEGEIGDMKRNLENHRKYLLTKASFFERHYRIKKV